jgi:DNA polymerase I
LKFIMKKQRFVIIDGNAIIHRAYHALPPLTKKDGTVVNAVYGFTSMLLKVIADLDPTHLIVTFDVAGGTFRDEVYKEYKATRVKAAQDLYDQIPLVHELVRSFDIPIYLKKGFEADDVIATVVKDKQLKSVEIEKIIVTGDKDLLQLVKDDVHVYLLKKGFSVYQLYDKEEVIKQFEFEPISIIDYKAFRGDSSDNIPGIKGVGEKSATLLISQYKTLEKIYELFEAEDPDFLESIKPALRKKLESGKEDAIMSKKLATIVCDVPDIHFSLDDSVLNVDYTKVRAFLLGYEFASLIRRLPTQTRKEENKKDKKKGFVKVDNNNIDSFLQNIEKNDVFGCKILLSQSDIFLAKIIGFAFSIKDEIFWIEMPLLNKPEQEKIYRIFGKKEKTFVGHDVKKIIKSLEFDGVEVKTKLFDLMIASYLTNSSVRAHDMDAIVMRELGERMKKDNGQESLFGTDPSAIVDEVDRYQILFEIYTKKLKDDNNSGLFDTIEMELIPALVHTELAGVGVDTEKLVALQTRVDTALDVVTKKIYKEAGKEFNVASSQQLRNILFLDLNLSTKGIKKGKTGYSTAASELEKLKGVHPIIILIEEHRELAKLKSTYVDVLPKLVHSNTGRIHTTFNQAVTTTGRLSSSDPNLQNIPIRSELGREIRDAFVADSGNILIAADYSQIELRVIASLAKDKNMIETFKNGEDIHSATAAAINGVELKDVTKKMRSAAKGVNFGVLYGMGAHGLAVRIGVTREQAQEFIDKYFEKYFSIREYLDRTIEFAQEEGYVETLFGRRRYVPELHSGNFQSRNAGERMAINMPIQGTAADIMKLAMIGVYKKLKKHENKEIRENTNIILQVHDELVVETLKGTEEEVACVLKEEMEGVVKLDVPVNVVVDIGNSWGGLK